MCGFSGVVAALPRVARQAPRLLPLASIHLNLPFGNENTLFVQKLYTLHGAVVYICFSQANLTI